MKIFISEGNMRISLQGELDHHAARLLMKKIEEAIEAYMPKSCVLDMEELNFMDSSGIALILKAYRLMNSLNGELSVTNPGAQPLRVIDAAGVSRLINVAVKNGG